ncbi:MAG TPA: prolyl oligopeptidase family serine peptidase [Pseudonocardiaceae bacterium]
MGQPVARVDVVRETLFGTALADPYRWMEEDGAEFGDWTAGQAQYADEYLQGLPGRSELLARVAELTASAVTSSGFAMAGDRVFLLRQDVDADVPVLVVRDGAGERVLLDPAELSGDEHSHLDWYVPCPDGSRVVVGISRGGSENSTLRMLDVATGALSADGVTGTLHGAVRWLPDGTGFVYHRYRDPAPGTPPAERRHNSGTYLHRLGTGLDEDVLVLARGLNPGVPMAPPDRPFLTCPAGSDWMIAVISHSALGASITEALNNCTFYVAPRAALADPTTCPWRKVADPADGVTAHATHGDTLYLVTYRDAPRSRVLAVSLAEVAEPAVVVPCGERAVSAVHEVGKYLLVRDIDGGVSRLRRVPLAGGAPQDVPLPVEGTITEFTAHPDGSSAFLVLSSWTHSPRAYRYDGTTVEDTGWIPPSPVDFGGIEVTDVRVPVRDGTLVPLTVLHRKGIALDGTHPALLTGYGSYGFVRPRQFAPELLAWYERGGIYALAGLRGGGEYGPEWHEAGRGLNKENTITDFIDCAEYLVATGYTRPDRLAGEGGSAGGIPTGGALVRRPDLWAAMVMHVPAVNLTRQEFSENGPINTPEFGTVTTEDGLRDLLIVDSYLRIEDGTRYPAVLLTAGLNDPRVAAWQPAKMAARLQAATRSGRPVLLRVDPHAGHGFGSTREQRNAVDADGFAFLLNELR